nr:MAG TPA: hypothetical protein [Bacteriophage sp.]
MIIVLGRIAGIILENCRKTRRIAGVLDKVRQSGQGGEGLM